MRDFPNDILARNLLALSGYNLAEATSIGEAHPDPAVRVTQARTKDLVPLIEHESRIKPLHSKFDPQKEAQRVADQVQDGGFVIVLGFGGGYHIRSLLQNSDIESLLIIDFGYDMFRAVLSHIDVSDIFIDSRVRLFIEPEPSKLHTYLLDRYIPAVMGNIRSVPLRSRTAMNELFFDSVLKVIEKTISVVSEDYSVQARFGRRWMSNTLANLSIAAEANCTITPQRQTMVIAAGPTLDDCKREIMTLRAHSYCIATDTAIPWLLHHNITPDIILSIDCQLVTYHHFFQSIPKHVPILFDLASPPTLTRTAAKPLFFSSGHPFSQYLNAHYKRFPNIDTSGGNVTHAAISLAHSLGAVKIDIFGADYCYPNGKTYANSTYLYNYFRSSENRFTPEYSQMANFVFCNSRLKRQWENNTALYSTPTLNSYRKRLIKLSEAYPVNIQNHSPFGPKFQISPQKPQSELPIMRWTSDVSNVIPFLRLYADKLNELIIPDGDLTRFFTDQSKESLQLWMTLFPAVSCFRYSSKGDYSGGRLLEITRSWTVEEIHKTIIAHA